MKKTDTVIVGQGIAGTVVAFLLHKNKIPFTVIDPGWDHTSSRIAAGMFTPVSGKRSTIQPLVPQQINYAVEIYREIEILLGVSILHQPNIYQVYQSEEERNVLAAKFSSPAFATYILSAPAAIPGLKQEAGACEITHSGWIDCALMIGGFANWLVKNEALISEYFVHDDLQFGDASMKYHGFEFKHIIFCEGYRAVSNPFFKKDIIPCSGDLLTIECDLFTAEKIVKKNGLYLIPIGDHQFRAGSTYRWSDSSELPNEAGKKFIVEQLNSLFSNDYKIIDHKTAVRPTTKHREIIAKRHPRHNNMFMLNGLGTRGILHGPWWADQLVKFFVKDFRSPG